MDNIWLAILAGSLTGLCFIIFKIRWRWLRYTLINFAIAAVVLFIVNQTGILGSHVIPVNPVTVGTVALLGLPGVAVLMGLKVILI